MSESIRVSFCFRSIYAINVWHAKCGVISMLENRDSQVLALDRRD